MSLSKNTPQSEPHPSNYDITRVELASELLKYLNDLNDFYQSLQAGYEIEIYEGFEKRFRAIRFAFKNMLFGIDNKYHDYISRSDLRKKAVSMIIGEANQVAKAFQNARETNRLDRVECTDYIENLIVLIQNLRTLASGK
jgi:hypothetical protein